MIVTLTTDFGFGEYVAAMKGVILSIDPEANIIDVSHSVSPGNIREGAFVLHSVVPYFPPAVHVAVVDPGVGTERRGIVVHGDKGVLVGPDNGLLMPAARKLGINEVREISNMRMCLDRISDTFHGRDVFAPIAAHISAGVDPTKVGPQVDNCVDLDFGEWRESEKEIEGEVVYADRFGNVITNIPGDAVLARATFGESVNLELGRTRRIAKLLRSYGFGKRNRPLLTISSSGFLEISIRDGNAQNELGLSPGDHVSMRLASLGKEISK